MLSLTVGVSYLSPSRAHAESGTRAAKAASKGSNIAPPLRREGQFLMSVYQCENPGKEEKL